MIEDQNRQSQSPPEKDRGLERAARRLHVIFSELGASIEGQDSKGRAAALAQLRATPLPELRVAVSRAAFLVRRDVSTAEGWCRQEELDGLDGPDSLGSWALRCSQRSLMIAETLAQATENDIRAVHAAHLIGRW
ncbi:hypothetical protein ABMY26_34035 [Azospirillum sp. HJ39]|uniref:hypothetical protein n=1 Tax=Azospirillum sp. HJ39 TaxID=3159496 RepID=UPI0035563C95